MENSFIPKDFFNKIMRFWYYLPLAMILGGMIGFFLHGLFPPVFEGQAKFVVTIDYTRTGYLSDIQEDQAMRSIGSLIDSDYVHQLTVETVNSTGEKITLSEMKEISRLERGEFEWYIRIRHPNPDFAANLVNLWADQADQVLKDSLVHAFKSEQLLNYLDSIEMCLNRISLNFQTLSPCNSRNIDDLLNEISSVGTLADQERNASHGMMPAVSVSLVARSHVPTQPVEYAENAFILAGSLAGLMASLIFLGFIISKEKTKETSRKIRG